ncbi:MAG: hypothetical protein WC299_08555 [Kiritimatiellia bacterium]
MLLMAFSSVLEASQYFTGKNGSDANDGLSREKAFLTVQKGMDALQPGDTLTVLPGEYLENVRRDGLGSNDVTTTIRAEIPGTAVLRGDIPLEGLKKVDGTRFIYMADIAVTGAVAVVNELDTLKIFERMPNEVELKFIPGVFYQDQAAGKIYISTSDMHPADTHRYTATVIATHGIYLSNARRVILEGLAVTGFNAIKEMPSSEHSLGSVWGIIVVNGKNCVIRNCQAWMNGQGMSFNSTAETCGDNMIEKCSAWANATQFGSGDRGGFTLIDPRRDAVRDSISFLNGEYGINIRGGPWGSNENYMSVMAGNLAWGNMCDYKIKTGFGYVHFADRCVGLGQWSLNGGGRSDYCLIGKWKIDRTPDNIKLDEEKDLDMQKEFADPENYDFRLQATSRFRKSAPGGKDRGPFQYGKNIFYASAQGDDKADGLSVGRAWKTLSRASRELRPGDTLYILPGVYEGGFELSLKGAAGKPVCIRGRGHGPVIIRGTVAVKESGGLEMQRLIFNGDVQITGGKEIAFDNCQFGGMDAALAAEKLSGLKLTHCVFAGFKKAGLDIKDCTGVCMSGNIFDNAGCPALRVEGKDGINYSDYNSYRDLASIRENYSRQLVPVFADEGGVKVLKNKQAFAALGPLGKPIGLYRDEQKSGALELVEQPKVHSLSATTANIEWMTSLPAECELAWGDTPGCAQTQKYDVNRFGAFSLTGLKPGQTYYFRIKSLRAPSAYGWLGLATDEEIDASPIELKGEPLSFTTPKENPAPVAYYVAPDGKDSNSGLDRKSAWKTIQHAADKANAGDTVLIAGGKYCERVIIRATGETNAPVTFKCLPGEKVVMDGNGKALNSSFVVLGKSNLRFDGFYLAGSNRERLGGWIHYQCGEFKLYNCKNIEISRCFSDGRGGYTARTITALHVENLLVKNCVTMNKMSGAMSFGRCPGIRLENNILARPMISSFGLNNTGEQKMFIENNIFTDMLEKKAKMNIDFAELENASSLQLRDNCFLFRCFPPEKRIVFCDVDHAIHKVTKSYTIGDFDAEFGDTRTLFADPLFAGDPGVKGNPKDKSGYAPDRMMDPGLKLDFSSFFATDPEVVKRGIGLQPEAFKDFVFNP